MGRRGGSHCASDGGLTLSNLSENRRQQWVIRLSHPRLVRRLSLRVSIYQFRVRVPVDLRGAIGRSYVKRSVDTDSPSLAIRLSRKVAFEFDAMFEQKRQAIASTTVISAIPPRSVQVPASISRPTLSEVYEQYLQNPTKQRTVAICPIIWRRSSARGRCGAQLGARTDY